MKTFAVYPLAAQPTIRVRTGNEIETFTFTRKLRADKKILALVADGYNLDPTHQTMIIPRRFYVVAEQYDEFIAGTIGDVEWTDKPGKPTCFITTDDADVLMARFDNDDNVSSYEEVLEGDDR